MAVASSLLHLLVFSTATRQVIGRSPWTTSPPGASPRPTTPSLSCEKLTCPRPMVRRSNAASFDCNGHPSGCSTSRCCEMPLKALRSSGATPSTQQTCGTFVCPTQMVLKPMSDSLLCAESQGCSVGFCCLHEPTPALTATPISVVEARLFAMHRRHRSEKVDSSLQKESDAQMMPIYVVVLLSIGCLGIAVAASACTRKRHKTTYRFNMEAMVEADFESDFEEEDRATSSDYSVSAPLNSNS